MGRLQEWKRRKEEEWEETPKWDRAAQYIGGAVLGLPLWIFLRLLLVSWITVALSPVLYLLNFLFGWPDI